MTMNTDQILKLAEIIREVDGGNRLGAAALAEAILSHPGSRWSPTVEPEPEGPIAWMYLGEPDYDGRDWHDHWEVTLSERLARFKSDNKDPVPLWRKSAIDSAPQDSYELRGDTATTEAQ